MSLTLDYFKEFCYYIFSKKYVAEFSIEDGNVYPKMNLKVLNGLSKENKCFIVNKAFDNYPYKSSFKWMIKLTIKENTSILFNKHDNAFNKIESRLLKSKKNYHLICRNFNKNKREVIYYGNNPFFDLNYFDSKLNSLDKNIINIEVKSDDNWQLVSNFIS